jgi:hypothetical protein
MPLVKLFWVDTYYSSDSGDHTHFKDASKWTVVTEDELKLLQANKYSIKKPKGCEDMYAMLVVADDTPVEVHLADIKAVLAEAEKRREALKKKREAAAKKTVAEKEAALKAKRLKQFEALAKEFGQPLPETMVFSDDHCYACHGEGCSKCAPRKVR